MNEALNNFIANLNRARDLLALADRISALTTNAVDVSDCLRAALVQGVSALDHFVHEIVRIGMLDVQRGTRPPTPSHLSFKVPLSATRRALADALDVEWLNEAVRETHGWLSFQHPDKVADALRLVSPVPLWDTLSAHLGVSKRDLKARLTLIVDRRNKIAHEADVDPTDPPTRWPITGVMVLEALDYLERLGAAIVAII
ncbi:hypothetical protein [Burkholderia gladioli]|uniref:hypothetical protein n=1 Tax=Burkholderia gladioli TaxID=28095 RepID=UPI0016417365|nr:hypothetical protein [Burkholderia gladioli]